MVPHVGWGAALAASLSQLNPHSLGYSVRLGLLPRFQTCSTVGDLAVSGWKERIILERKAAEGRG